MTEVTGKISVVVISYNGREFIENCLRTIEKSLNGCHYELIVVDNGSADGSVDWIKENFSSAILIENKSNLGFAHAVNQGIKKASGDYILIHNQDTKILDDAIIKLAARIGADNTIGSIGPKFIGFDGRLQQSARSFPKYRDLLWQFTGLSYFFPKSKLFARWKMGWFDHLTEKEVDQPMGASLMISRRTVQKVGLFDESFRIFFNDVDYCRRIMESGLKNVYYPEAVIMHYVGGSTRKNKARMILESHRAMYRYFRKYNRTKSTLPLLWFWGCVLYITGLVRAAISAIFKI